MMSQNCIDIRDAIIGFDGIDTLIGLIYDEIDIDTAKAICWTLSILSGVSLKG